MTLPDNGRRITHRRETGGEMRTEEEMTTLEMTGENTEYRDVKEGKEKSG